MIRGGCWAVLVAVCAWSSPLHAETLCVEVMRGNQPVANTRVTVGFVRQYTNQSGRVCFDNIAAGKYQIIIGSGRDTRTCYGATSGPDTVCHI